jgi:hypothetical protein
MNIIKFKSKYYKKINDNSIFVNCSTCSLYVNSKCINTNFEILDCSNGYFIEIDIKEIRKQKLEKINNNENY